MSTLCSVVSCGRPTQDMLCSLCLKDLTGALHLLVHDGADVKGNRRPGLLEELQVTVTRQDQLVSPMDKTSASAESALAFHAAASEVSWVADNTVTTWARDMAETYPHLSLTATTTVQAAEWLANLPSLLAVHPAASEILNEVTSLVIRIKQIIDIAAPRFFVGQCGHSDEHGTCTVELYAREDKNSVHCPQCQTEYSVDERRLMMLAVLNDQLATAVEIAPAMQRLTGREAKVDTIRSWKHNKKLFPHGHTASGQPLYRIGDVIELLMTTKNRQRGARAKNAAIA
jgi:hypothetical protein